jgi:RecB family exonuclease
MAYRDGKSVVSDAPAPLGNPAAGEAADASWSPSAIDDFFNCPRHFFLTRILGIEEPETDDPFEVIHDNEVGTLAHSLMEQLGINHPQKDAFLKLAGETFDRFLLSRPPVHPEDAEREKQRFLRMMQNAFETDPGMDIVLSEEKKTVTHPAGVTLRGIPDRVERTKDGRYQIVDFKTGRSLKHNQDDIATCLQVLIYAYMMEQSGYEITGCEYRYIRSRKTVTCRYDEEMKAKLAERLTEFRGALVSGDYPCAESEDSCRWCKLSSICGRNRKEAEEGEEDSDE